MKIIVIGDFHGRIPEELTRAIEIIEPDFLLNTGEVWDIPMRVDWGIPFYFILGNHEILTQINDIPLKENNIMLFAGLHQINGINIVALPSSPMPGTAPGPALYSQEDYEKCYNVEEEVHVFLSHGCAFPFFVWTGSRRINVEDQKLTELVRKLRPNVASFSGHNHAFAVEEHEGIKCIRLGSRGSDLFYPLEI